MMQQILFLIRIIKNMNTNSRSLCFFDLRLHVNCGSSQQRRGFAPQFRHRKPTKVSATSSAIAQVSHLSCRYLLAALGHAMTVAVAAEVRVLHRRAASVDRLIARILRHRNTEDFDCTGLSSSAPSRPVHRMLWFGAVLSADRKIGEPQCGAISSLLPPRS